MSHAKRRWKRSLSGIAVVILMPSIIAVTLIAHHDRPLLTQAVAVMGVRDHSLPMPMIDYPSFWTSQHTVLTVFHNHGSYRCLEKDITTGRTLELADLNRRLDAHLHGFGVRQFPLVGGMPHRQDIVAFAAPAAVSPDGQWLLWRDDAAVTVFSIHSKRMITCASRDFAFQFYWAHDSRHWVGEWMGNADSKTYQPLVFQDLGAPSMMALRTIPMTDDEIVLGLTDTGSLLTWAPDPATAGFVMLSTYSSGINPKLTRRQRVPIPGAPRGAVTELRMSPNADRMAWLVTRPAHSGGPLLLDRLMTLLGVRHRLQSPRQDVYVSTLDGRGMTTVGFHDLDQDGYGVDELEWSPDGTRLGFRCRGTFWFISAISSQ